MKKFIPDFSDKELEELKKLCKKELEQSEPNTSWKAYNQYTQTWFKRKHLLRAIPKLIEALEFKKEELKVLSNELETAGCIIANLKSKKEP